MSDNVSRQDEPPSRGPMALSVQDRAELVELIVEFAWRVDHNQANSIHELCTDDARIEMHYGPMNGKDAIAAWGKDRSVVVRTTRHIMTNFRFVVLDSGRVEGSCLALTFRHDGTGLSPALPWAVAEFCDVFVRGEVGWRFLSRTSTDVFISEE